MRTSTPLIKRVVAISFVLLSLMIVACSSAPQHPSHDPYRIMREIPQQYQFGVAMAESLGTEIYLQDMAAWVVTDFLAEQGVLQSDGRLRGWVTEHLEEDGHMRVTFIGEVDSHPLALYQVETQLAEVLEDTYLPYPSGEPLTARQLALFTSRQTAIQGGFAACSERYNTAVIPFSDEQGEYNLVYLLAASTEAGVVHLGGNHLITTDASGSAIIEQRALSKSCLTMQMQESTAALTFTHLVEPTPNAVHVFLSLLHKVPLYISTTENDLVWKVDRNTITIIER